MSIWADEGTAAHQVLEECLRLTWEIGIPTEARAYIGQTRRIEDGPHAVLSPSGAKRWMTCAAAPSMEALHPELQADGPREIEVTDEMASAVQEALDYVEVRVNELRDMFPDHTVTVIPERRVSPMELLHTAACDGTSDITITVMGKNTQIIYVEQADYKHGKGVPVSIDDPQLDLYLLGSIAESGVMLAEDKSARVTVIQPRCDKIEPRIRHRDIEDVDAWFEGFYPKLRAAIDATRADNPPATASEEACRFCSARGSCTENARFALASIGVIEEDQPLPDSAADIFQGAEEFAERDTRLLTVEQMVGILDIREMVTGMLQAVEAYALELFETDTAPQALRNRYKMVRGRSNRRYAFEEDETVRRLKRIKGTDPETGKTRALGKKDLYEQKLRNVAAVERTLKALMVEKTGFEAFKALIDKPEGKLTIAPISDPRPAVELRQSPEDAFAEPPPSAAPDAPEAQEAATG